MRGDEAATPLAERPDWRDMLSTPATSCGFYTAPAISPDGTDVYVVYKAFTTPYRTIATDPRCSSAW